mmetsp:Transcript_40915/g.102884  ORF Transcript_40915/g.102884 Transcript_40915/m.102884 type:complete len:203 (+) Transcript_40915:654-1262(+)
MQVDGRGLLGVDADDVSAGLGKVSHTLLRLDDHQVNVKNLVGHGTDGVHNQWADGDVGHKTAIHDIDVHPVAPGLIDGLDLVAELGEVGGEDGGRDDDVALAAASHAGVAAGLGDHRHALAGGAADRHASGQASSGGEGGDGGHVDDAGRSSGWRGVGLVWGVSGLWRTTNEAILCLRRGFAVLLLLLSHTGAGTRGVGGGR